MSASLDKSLDDIISSSKKSSFRGRSRPGSKLGSGGVKRVGKKVGGTNNKKAIVSFKKGAAGPAAAAAAAKAFDLSYATKVNVTGLPKDLKQENIKDFFQSQVGGVHTVALSYNEKGQFRGHATVIFKNNKNATLAIEKYNGAPIDNGSSKLKLELIVDPSKRPLSTRISPNKVGGGATNPKIIAAKQALNKKKGEGKKPPQKKGKPAKKGKKTIEELDQEMADYFES
ncbi:RNA annealing protein YRA1 [Spathaspora sp. JA1]|nr:RNA annealing protein YRA1 [Spathaspora sp. JA1]